MENERLDNSTLLVSPDWLADRLDNPQIAIADCRFKLTEPEWGRQQFELGRIRTAIHFDLNRDLSSPVETHGGRHPLPNPDRLAAKLSSAGISIGETLVIAYDDARGAFAARLWWLLRYLGHDRVALLDGGWPAWQAGGYPISREEPQPTPASFVPRLRPEMVVDIAQVRERKDRAPTVLADARDRDRYLGEREPIDPVAGHIPGAINRPWKDAVDEQGFMRSPQQQRSRWADCADAEEIIAYCGSGVTACVNLFSLELAGIKTGKLYAGSWSDWCSYL